MVLIGCLWSIADFIACGVRFKTNADVLPGVEKLAISVQRADLGLHSGITLSARDVDASAKGLTPPHGVFLVKGWSRVLAMLTVAACAWQCEAFREAG